METRTIQSDIKLCGECIKNLRTYYNDCIHKTYGNFHDIFMKIIVDKISSNITEKIYDAQYKIHERDTLLKFVSTYLSAVRGTSYSLLDGLIYLYYFSEKTFSINTIGKNVRVVDTRYFKNKLEDMYGEYYFKYGIPIKNFMGDCSIKGNCTLEHVIPKFNYECNDKTSLNCRHIVDPYNVLFIDKTTNFIKGNYSYGTSGRLDAEIKDNNVILHKIDGERRVVEPRTNGAKFIIGTKLLYDAIVRDGDVNNPDIINWVFHNNLEQHEIDTIKQNNITLSKYFGITYTYFNPNDVNQLIFDSGHTCIHNEKCEEMHLRSSNDALSVELRKLIHEIKPKFVLRQINGWINTKEFYGNWEYDNKDNENEFEYVLYKIFDIISRHKEMTQQTIDFDAPDFIPKSGTFLRKITQKGGNELSDNHYFKKYLKYKSKYTNSKNGTH
jgi:hypothetical protein